MNLVRYSDEQGWGRDVCFLYYLELKKINTKELNDLFHSVHKKEVLEGTEPEVTYHLFYVTVKYHPSPKTFFDIQTWFDTFLP